MAFGIPYKGSKNIYAKKVCEALPSGKRLVDLFAGGCAITDCAIRKFPSKWESFLINDIACEPLDLYSKCLRGENPVSYDWVSRDDFKSKDWATRLVWSFGNDTRSYIYGKEIEPIKHDIESWIVDGVILNNSSILCNVDLPKLETMKGRYDWWREYRWPFLKLWPYTLKRQQRMERMERLDRLKCLECLDRLEFSHLSYEQYEYKKGMSFIATSLIKTQVASSMQIQDSITKRFGSGRSPNLSTFMFQSVLSPKMLRSS